MGKEGEESYQVRLSGIHVDFEQKKVTLEAAGSPLAHLRWSPDEGTVIFEVPRGPAVDLPEAEPTGLPSQVEEAAGRERESTVTLRGRLKSKPKEGSPDRGGKPTAWARFAAHHEGEDEAHLYSATFHRHTRAIALSLNANDPLVVQGYPHENDDPQRMDTLSVINIVQYPGKLGKEAKPKR